MEQLIKSDTSKNETDGVQKWSNSKEKQHSVDQLQTSSADKNNEQTIVEKTPDPPRPVAWIS